MSAVATPVLNRVQEELDRTFSRFFPRRVFGEPLFPLTAEDGSDLAWVPTLDLAETPKEFVARIEVPGVPKENLTVKLDGDLLTVAGHREREEERKGETYLWREQQFGRFTRTIRIPTPVTAANVEAVSREGVLTIRLPKVTAPPANQIPVK